MIVEKTRIEILDSLCYKEMLKKIEKCGRICYKSEDKIGEETAESFVKNILKRGHESVIEHVNITVRVICDRGVSHEIVRHRIASYSMESTRYCNYSKDKYGSQISCIDISTGFKYNMQNEKDVKKFEIWTRAMQDAEKYYFELLANGASPQEARGVLPNALKTELAITMNIRGWRHFIKLRTDKASHPQIRELAGLLLKEFEERYPVLFEDLTD